MFTLSQKAVEAPVDRRAVLRLALAGAVAAALPLFPGTAATAVGAAGAQWRVSVRNAHTGERFSGVYREGNCYSPEAFAQLNALLRDHRTGEAFPMDPRLLDMVTLLQRRAGVDTPMEVLCGYRSPKTNRALRRASTGVAKNSYHMYGQALDIRLPGVRTGALRGMARALRVGGVGYYPRSGFVHIDTGPVRTW
ncbi:MAG TPA: twin-arginine translocation pathway signal sequence domain-containing protein [Rhodospirillaceae bacterium]|nr:DUF882 domain-containing protein [Alphaproteobacteria bacterium]HBH26064.1 twin-arginine translocation pathway signal sequence domain-containing protein [Rhodospirillaceae bacterium]